jgi:hypothetical protein
VYQPPQPPTGYIKHLTVRDLSQCEGWLNQAAAAAGTPQQKARAAYFLEQFRACRAFVEPRLVSSARTTRLLALESLTGERLAFAVQNYLEWEAMHPADGTTNALRLTAALMLERAGRSGAWSDAFAHSPWADTETAWIAPFVTATTPLASRADKVHAVRITERPTIDGRLDDACWTHAKRVSDFRHFQQNTPLTQPVVAAFCHDRQNLYVAFCCLESSPQELVGNVREHDGPMWEDDSVEIFVAPDAPAGPDRFRQFIISVTGAVYDAMNRSTAAWNPDIAVKTAVGDRYWTVELAVPLAELGIPEPRTGAAVRLNVNRSRQVPALKEIGGWKFVDGRNDNVKTFGTLVFE